MRILALISTVALALVAGCGTSSTSTQPASTTTATAAGTSSVNAAQVDFQDGGFPPEETPVKGGRLKVALSANVDTWNGLSYYAISASFFSFLARGLYGYPNTVAEPDVSTIRADLAEDLPTISDDGLTYTVKLRDGLTFPDGRPVRAADVKATFEYMLDPNLAPATGGPQASGYYQVIEGVDAFTDAMTTSKGASTIGISGITAVDDLTVTFTLTRPDGSFLRALAMAWAFIRPANTPHELTATPPPFVGPYKVSGYATDKALTIDREPTWADNVAAGVPDDPGENNIDGLDLALGVPVDTQLLQIKSNQLDMSLDLAVPGGSDLPAVANDPEYADRFFSTPDAAVDYGVFRTDRPPFDDARLRQAVNLAIDRSLIVKITGGQLAATPWSQFLPPSMLGGEPTDVYPSQPDVDAAKKLIESSGIKTPIRVRLAHMTVTPGPDVAVAAKEALAAVGFEVELKPISPDVFNAYTADPTSDFHLAIAGWGQDYPDAITFFGPLLSCPQGTPGGANLGHFCDPELDKAIAQINQLAPGPDRAARFAKLSTDTMRETAPWWPIDSPRRNALISDRVRNYRWSPTKLNYFASYFLKDG